VGYALRVQFNQRDCGLQMLIPELTIKRNAFAGRKVVDAGENTTNKNNQQRNRDKNTEYR
jgi:hypothetical protein